MKHLAILPALAWAGLATGGAHAQITSTYNTLTNPAWTDADNWDNVPDVDEYPDNGNGGFFFSAIIPPSVITDIGAESIDLDALTLQSNTSLKADAGGVMIVSGITSVDALATSKLDVPGGTFLANGPLNAFGTLRVGGAWQLTINGELFVPGALTLDGGGSPRATIFGGAIVQGDLGLQSNPSGSSDSAELINQGGSEIFFTTSSSHTLVPTFTDNGGVITVQNGGSLTFPAAFAGSTQLVTLNGTTLNALGELPTNSAEINFNRNTRINGSLTVQTDLGEVTFFAGVHELLAGSTIDAAGTESGGAVTLAGSAQVIGTGTINCSESCAFEMNGGVLGPDDGGDTTIFNTGKFSWGAGEIRGLTNQATTPGDFSTVSLAGGRSVSGLLKNEGHATQGFIITVAGGARIENSSGATWNVVGGNTTGAGSFANEGIYLKSNGVSSIMTTIFTNTGTVHVSDGSLDLRNSIDLDLGEVLEGGGDWLISGNGRLFFNNGARKIRGISDGTRVTVDGPNAVAPLDPDGLFFNDGSLRLLNGAKFETGPLQNNTSTQTSGGSEVDVEDVINQGSFVADDSTTIADGDWSGSGSAEINGGSVGISGSVDCPGGSWSIDENASVGVGGDFGAGQTSVEGQLDITGDLLMDPVELEEVRLGSDTTGGQVTADELLAPAGTIGGNGAFQLRLLDADGATIDPGFDDEPCGVLDFALSEAGSFDATTSVVMDMEPAGGAPAPGRGAVETDTMSFAGPMTLAGTLEVRSAAPVQLDPGEGVALITGDQLSGSFDQVVYPQGTFYRVEYSPTAVTLIGRCAADLAPPFESLDFSDVIAFLSAFGASVADADLAEPFGSLDFSDIIAFLTSFGAGCP